MKIDIFGWWRRQIEKATLDGVKDAMQKLVGGDEADDDEVRDALELTSAKPKAIRGAK